MARKRIKLSTGFVFFGLLFAGNVLLFMPQEKTKQINYFFVRNMAPVLNAIPKPKTATKKNVPISKYNEIVRKYNDLVEKYNMRVSQLEEMRNKNEALSLIRKDYDTPGSKFVIAKVFKTTLDGQRNELLINKGSADKIQKGQYVLSAEQTSVIGTIKDVAKNMARVQLVTDINHHIPVFISRTDDISIKELKKITGKKRQMVGKNKVFGKIPLIPKDRDIQIGDVVFAAAKPGSLEIPLQIGNITKAKLDEKSPIVWDVKVEPLVNYDEVREVAVIVVDTEQLNSNEE